MYELKVSLAFTLTLNNGSILPFCSLWFTVDTYSLFQVPAASDLTNFARVQPPRVP